MHGFPRISFLIPVAFVKIWFSHTAINHAKIYAVLGSKALGQRIIRKNYHMHFGTLYIRDHVLEMKYALVDKPGKE